MRTALGVLGLMAIVIADAPATWTNDISSITAADWTCERAAHLLECALCGGTPEGVNRLAALTPQQAVESHNIRSDFFTGS